MHPEKLLFEQRERSMTRDYICSCLIAYRVREQNTCLVAIPILWFVVQTGTENPFHFSSVCTLP